MTVDFLQKKTVKWLKNELRLYCQPTTGKMADHVQRLKKAYDDKLKRYNSVEEATASKKKVLPKTNKLDGMTSFHPDAYWRELFPKEAPVEEPLNASFKIARAPTILPEEAEFVPVKHDFTERFKVPDFTGTSVKYEKNRGGILKKNANGNPTQNQN